MFKKYTDMEIIGGLGGDSPDKYKFEKYLFIKFRGLVGRGMKTHFLKKDQSLDCYCDAFVLFLVYVRRGLYDKEKPIASFLKKIFDRKCIDQIRRNTNLKNRPPAPLDELLGLGIREDSPLVALIKSDLIDQVQIQLGKMSCNCKKIIFLWSEGYSHKEIASEMPNLKNSNSSKSTLSNCLKKLRKLCTGLND